MVWRQRTCVTNYVDQQTLKPDDDYIIYVLPHQRLWTFDVLVCPLSSVGDRAFPVAAARLCNSLPSHVTAVPSVHLLMSTKITCLLTFLDPSF